MVLELEYLSSRQVKALKVVRDCFGSESEAMAVAELPKLRINGEMWTLNERLMEARPNGRPHDVVKVTPETMGRLKAWAREKVEVTYRSGRFSHKP